MDIDELRRLITKKNQLYEGHWRDRKSTEAYNNARAAVIEALGAEDPGTASMLRRIEIISSVGGIRDIIHCYRPGVYKVLTHQNGRGIWMHGSFYPEATLRDAEAGHAAKMARELVK